MRELRKAARVHGPAYLERLRDAHPVGLAITAITDR
jgi:hypothetical protein